ncbi:hypothetical protein [Pandoraea pnomenusa]|uniref:hypothetical protein n=1 Tax=Pandoraea pnomenusa TaxID=93220 RepID=UPI0011461CD7|nr:hypothetical protein [Pandoraea pnomenusa]QDH59452.1 hypothetical protein FKQ53_09270 [Pandoraea pnomenusa]
MHLWFGIPRVICIYVASAVTIGAIVFVQNVWDLSKSDWAAWAQAIGTVMAVGATAWVATADARRRQGEARLRRALACSAITPRAAHANAIVKSIRDELQRIRNYPPGQYFLRRELQPMVERFGQVATPQEIEALAGLPKNVPFRLAAATSMYFAFRGEIEHVGYTLDVVEEADYQASWIARWDMYLNEVDLNLTATSQQCQLVSLGLTSPYQDFR